MSEKLGRGGEGGVRYSSSQIIRTVKGSIWFSVFVQYNVVEMFFERDNKEFLLFCFLVTYLFLISIMNYISNIQYDINEYGMLNVCIIRYFHIVILSDLFVFKKYIFLFYQSLLLLYISLFILNIRSFLSHIFHLYSIIYHLYFIIFITILSFFISIIYFNICILYLAFVSPSAFSGRAVVSYWRKYVHEVLVNR